MKFTSTTKGIITGLLMVAIGLALAFQDEKEGTAPAWQYAGTVVYALGIVWSVVAYAAKNKDSRFGELFQQGFRCFIVATLILAVYTFAYWKANPQQIDKIIEASKQERIQTAQDRTPAEIDQEAQQTRKYFIPFNISGMIFSNLLIGAVVTMATAGSLSLRNKNA